MDTTSGGAPFNPEDSPGLRSILDGSAEMTLSVRRAAFASLRAGRALDVERLGPATGLDPGDAKRALEAVVSVGIAVIREGRIVGMDGLTVEDTPHGLVLQGVPLHTWCAFDIVGIPVALGVGAIGTTTCRHCGSPITLEFHDGRLPRSDAVGWVPTAICSNVVAEFCPDAWLFCDTSHIDAWRATSRDIQGQALELHALAALGRAAWASTKEGSASAEGFHSFVSM